MLDLEERGGSWFQRSLYVIDSRCQSVENKVSVATGWTEENSAARRGPRGEVRLWCAIRHNSVVDSAYQCRSFRGSICPTYYQLVLNQEYRNFRDDACWEIGPSHD